MMIQMPKEAQEILEKLNHHGFEAYIVGGCVRDSLLKKEPEDWDITTSARPEEVKAIFGRTIDTGIQHGTVTIMRGKTGYEVTTYRIDGKYEDGRHPKTVEFTSSLEEDLKRRDFTINAMAYSPGEGLIDMFGGVRDLTAKTIRCVGTAADRFTEDALRILRAVRFCAQLGFEIEQQTWDAIKTIGPNLSKVSKERIQAELTKLLISPHPGHIKDIFTCSLESCISPAFAALDPETIFINPKLPQEKYLRWASCLKDQSPEEAASILRDLKMDNDTINKVKLLVYMCPRPIGLPPAEIRRTMSQMPDQLFDSLILLKCSLEDPDNPKYSETPEAAADIQQPGIQHQNSIQSHISCQLRQLEQIRHTAQEIRRHGDCTSLKTLAVTGNDLIALGMKPGKQIGETLQTLLDLVLEHPERNQKEFLLSAVASLTEKAQQTEIQTSHLTKCK